MSAQAQAALPEESPVDLDAYFARIGYQGPRQPDFETLSGLQFAQATSVPFENLNILFGRGIALDPESLQRKIVRERRGGYCFEQNGLLLRVLRQLGFKADGLIGRVRWMMPEGAPPTGLTHMLIRVHLPEGPYLVDAGFGGIRQTVPLKLVPGLVQKTSHEDFRLVEEGSSLLLQADLGNRWGDICAFGLETAAAADYELGNWFTSTHPSSLFVNYLIAERPAPGLRKMLFNDMLMLRAVGEEPETHMLSSAEEIAAALDEHFDLPVAQDKVPVLEKFVGLTASL